MGSMNSHHTDANVPKLLYECKETENGSNEVDETKLMIFQRACQEQVNKLFESISFPQFDSYEAEEGNCLKKKWCKKGCIMMYDKELGGIQPMCSEESNWYCLFVTAPIITNIFRRSLGIGFAYHTSSILNWWKMQLRERDFPSGCQQRMPVVNHVHL
jgi:hypothetical protein